MKSRLESLFFGAEGYRTGYNPPEEFIHVNFKDGGLGDHVCRLPALKYLKDKYPHVVLSVWCPTFFLEFGKKALPDINWIDYKSAATAYMSQPVINAGSNCGITSLRTHLVDHAFYTILDETVGVEYKNYLKINHADTDISKFNLPQKYIVLTTGNTVKVREFKASVINEIVSYIKSKNINVVFLGNELTITGGGVENIKGNFSKKINYNEGLNLINKTSLIEAHAILAQSKAVIGLDNGLLHLAACSDVPIVMGFTTVQKEHRLPYRKNQLGWNCYSVEPDESLECRGCQSRCNFLYIDFRKCMYNDYKCVEDQTALSYIEHLNTIFNEEKM